MIKLDIKESALTGAALQYLKKKWFKELYKMSNRIDKGDLILAVEINDITLKINKMIDMSHLQMRITRALPPRNDTRTVICLLEEDICTLQDYLNFFENTFSFAVETNE